MKGGYLSRVLVIETGQAQGGRDGDDGRRPTSTDGLLVAVALLAVTIVTDALDGTASGDAVRRRRDAVGSMAAAADDRSVGAVAGTRRLDAPIRTHLASRRRRRRHRSVVSAGAAQRFAFCRTRCE